MPPTAKMPRQKCAQRPVGLHPRDQLPAPGEENDDRHDPEERAEEHHLPRRHPRRRLEQARHAEEHATEITLSPIPAMTASRSGLGGNAAGLVWDKGGFGRWDGAATIGHERGSVASLRCRQQRRQKSSSAPPMRRRGTRLKPSVDSPSPPLHTSRMPLTQLSAALTRDEAYRLVDAVSEREDLALTASAHEDTDDDHWVVEIAAENPDLAAHRRPSPAKSSAPTSPSPPPPSIPRSTGSNARSRA